MASPSTSRSLSEPASLDLRAAHRPLAQRPRASYILTRLRSSHRLLAAIACCAFPAVAEADVLVTRTGVTYDTNVHIDRIEGGQIYFTVNGNTQAKDVAVIGSIKLDDEPNYNAADVDYQAQKWEQAADELGRAQTSTDKAWLKDWIAPRLLDAANHANRLDTAVGAWLQVVNKDPAGASKVRPTLPNTPGASLDAAAAKLDSAAKSAKGDARQVILGFLLDVQTARKDNAGIQAAATLLQPAGGAVGPGNPTNTAAGDAMRSVEGETKLALARTALSGKKYDDVVAQIDAAGPVISDPTQQAEALFLKAQAMEGKASSGEDADAWKDAALAYMRVYAHFRTGPASTHAAAALMKTAAIEETHLKEPQAAATLYQKVLNEYKESPDAADAQQELSRLVPPKQG